MQLFRYPCKAGGNPHAPKMAVTRRAILCKPNSSRSSSRRALFRRRLLPASGTHARKLEASPAGYSKNQHAPCAIVHSSIEDLLVDSLRRQPASEVGRSSHVAYFSMTRSVPTPVDGSCSEGDGRRFNSADRERYSPSICNAGREAQNSDAGHAGG